MKFHCVLQAVEFWTAMLPRNESKFYSEHHTNFTYEHKLKLTKKHFIHNFLCNSHIKEHMEVPIDTSKMTEQELQFHYFTMHDSDKNNKLDGSELIKSLIHWHGKRNVEKQFFFLLFSLWTFKYEKRILWWLLLVIV